MALSPGDAFGRFRIGAVLGEGGMGKVFRAYDESLDRRVAIKIVRAPDGDDETRASFERRLQREARAAAAFEHPNAVAVYEVGAVDGQAFIAMELVEGKSLQDYVGDASVSLATKVRWITDVARALGAAHERGLVHRDVKPSNVMVRDDGAIKVLDFGIASRVDPSLAAAAADTITPTEAGADLAFSRTQPAMAAIARSPVATLTAEGCIVGTPLYMAPEQMRGEKVDARADQFSWGVLAYEVLAGRKPWGEAPSLSTLAEALSKEPPPLRATVPEVPASIEATILRALSKSRTRRFASMAEIVERLEGSTSRAARRLPRVVAAAAALSAVAAIGAGWMSLRRGWTLKPAAPTPPSASAIAATAPSFVVDGEAVALPELGRCADMPVFADDGTLIFQIRDAERQWIYRRDPITHETRAIVTSDGINSSPAPGGRGRVFYAHAGGGKSGSGVRSIEIGGDDDAPAGFAGRYAWAAGGSVFVLSPDQVDIRRRSTDGTLDVALYQAPEASTFTPHAVSSDGLFLATTPGISLRAPRPVCLGDVAAGKLDCTSAGASTARRGAFAPRGGGYYFAQGNDVVRFDLRTHQTTRISLPFQATALAIAPDARALVFSTCTWHATLARLESDARSTPIRASLDCAGPLSVGARGEIVCPVPSRAGLQVGILDASGTRVRIEGGASQLVTSAHLSPDGRMVAYSDESDTGGIFVVRLDDGLDTSPIRVTSDPGDEDPFWVDADHVLYRHPETGFPVGRAYVVSAAGGESMPLPPMVGTPVGAFLDRGSLLLEEEHPDGVRHYERSADGTTRRLRFDGDKGLRLRISTSVSSSGRWVVSFIGDADAAIWRLDTRTGKTSRLPLPPGHWLNAGVDDDGRVVVADKDYAGQLHEVTGRFE